jgi:hypothetical protein
LAQEIGGPTLPASETGQAWPATTNDRGLNLRKIGIAAALAAMVAVSACKEEVPYNTYGQQDKAGVIPGLKVTNARMVLAPVAGNPAAIYMDIAYSGDSALGVSGATLEGAKELAFHRPAEWDEKEMVETNDVSLKKGDSVSLAPGGKHIMVMDPPANLKPGSKVKLTLKIAGARTHDVEMDIRAAGEER